MESCFRWVSMKDEVAIKVITDELSYIPDVVESLDVCSCALALLSVKTQEAQGGHYVFSLNGNECGHDGPDGAKMAPTRKRQGRDIQP